MKKLIVIGLCFFVLYACTDPAKRENELKNQIIDMHEKVMNADEALMKNKMKLDTLLQQKKDTASVKPLIAKAEAADAAMEKWMSGFQPDVTGKSHDEAITYFTGQKKEIMTVDSQINTIVKESSQYLSSHK